MLQERRSEARLRRALPALFINQRGNHKAMTHDLKRKVLLFLLLAPVLLSACVSQSTYDQLQAQYRQVQQENVALQTQVAADKTQICRLAGRSNTP